MSDLNRRKHDFIKEIKRTLEERNTQLSPEILGQLDAIDHNLGSISHVQSSGPSQLTRMLSAGMLGAALLLLLALIFYPSKDPIIASLDDLDILTTKESPDFFIDLEFYAWLESKIPEGQNNPNQ